MKYLCLIYMDEKKLDALPAAELNALNAAHLDYNDSLRTSGHFIEAEALEPVATTACIRFRNGKPTVTDGPFAETKEQLAGFYLVEARDLNEAIQIAAKFPSASLGRVEVRTARRLLVDARAP
jgi:hypothetical protein